MSKNSIIADYLYSSEEVSEYLHVSLRTTQRLLKSGMLPSFRIHGQYRIKGLDILTYLDSVKRDISNPENQKNKLNNLIELLDINPISLELSLNISEILDLNNEESDINKNIINLRKKLILDLGFVFPEIKIITNSDLNENEFNILVNNTKVKSLEFNSDLNEKLLEYIFNELEIISKRYAFEVISREEVFDILERLRKKHYILIEEIISDENNSEKLSIGQLTKVLKDLLRENISIKNLPLILEIIADNINCIKNHDEIVEKVREGLSRQFCLKFSDENNLIEVITLNNELENNLILSVKNNNFIESNLSIKIQKDLKDLIKDKIRPIICSPVIRKHLRNILERNFYDVHVLSYKEIDRNIKISQYSELSL